MSTSHRCAHRRPADDERCQGAGGWVGAGVEGRCDGGARSSCIAPLLQPARTPLLSLSCYFLHVRTCPYVSVRVRSMPVRVCLLVRLLSGYCPVSCPDVPRGLDTTAKEPPPSALVVKQPLCQRAECPVENRVDRKSGRKSVENRSRSVPKIEKLFRLFSLSSGSKHFKIN